MILSNLFKNSKQLTPKKAMINNVKVSLVLVSRLKTNLISLIICLTISERAATIMLDINPDCISLAESNSGYFNLFLALLL